jgi:hypothetical protein
VSWIHLEVQLHEAVSSDIEVREGRQGREGKGETLALGPDHQLGQAQRLRWTERVHGRDVSDVADDVVVLGSGQAGCGARWFGGSPGRDHAGVGGIREGFEKGVGGQVDAGAGRCGDDEVDVVGGSFKPGAEPEGGLGGTVGDGDPQLS